MIPEARDGAGQHGLDALALTNFAADIIAETFIRGTAHKPERFPDFGFRDDIQIGRLLQLHRKRLFQRAIENGVAGRVHEVREQHTISLSQL